MRKALRGGARAGVTSAPAPKRGLSLSQPIPATDPLSAEVVDNFLPTQRGLKVRGGLTRAAYISDAVKSMLSYVDPSAPKLFAASADAIYDITSLDAVNAPTASVAGLTNGEYSFQQIGTAGGSFLFCVNGADEAQLYDGADWNPVNASAVNEISYDALSADFSVGETVTGGTSGASATILSINPSSATEGTLKVGAITSGPFQDNEALTSAGGSATANGASAAASSITISGVDTSDLSHVWLYRSRLFFVEKDTLSAWYLPVDSVGGTANSVGLAGVFKRGGSLMLGATWSLDSGDGIDDVCVFISTEGEVAIYEGADPSSSSTWALSGRYDIGRPLGKEATMQAGGDLLIATVDGIVPLSQVIQKDPAALSLAAVTRPIEKTWSLEVQRAMQPVSLLKWTEESLGCCIFPDSTRMPTVNLQTGGWGMQTGWVANCAALFQRNAYIGRSNGRIYKLNDGGLDDGEVFTARYCHSFSDLGSPAAYKRAQMVRFAFFSDTAFDYRAGVSFDYNIEFPAPPGSAEVAPSNALIWDTDDWDSGKVWGGTVSEADLSLTSEWRSVVGGGYALAPTLQITSGATNALNIEVVRADMTFDVGGIVV